MTLAPYPNSVDSNQDIQSGAPETIAASNGVVKDNKNPKWLGGPKEYHFKLAPSVVLDPKLPRTAILVWTMAASYANNKTGHTWVGTNTLAKRLGISDRMVRYAWQLLEERGHVKTVNKVEDKLTGGWIIHRRLLSTGGKAIGVN
jgi:hypothetical protein